MATGRISPGNLAAKEMVPGSPSAWYSVRKRPPPATVRLSAPNIPFDPAPEVEVDSWIEGDIHESSPPGDTRLWPGSSSTCSTGITVPRTR